MYRNDRHSTRSFVSPLFRLFACLHVSLDPGASNCFFEYNDWQCTNYHKGSFLSLPLRQDSSYGHDLENEF
jgi:hypothetical protein